MGNTMWFVRIMVGMPVNPHMHGEHRLVRQKILNSIG